MLSGLQTKSQDSTHCDQQTSSGSNTVETTADSVLPKLPTLEQSTSLQSPSFSVQKQMTQPTLANVLNTKKRQITNEQKDRVTRALTRYIVKDMQPFSTIASEPFRSMLKELNPEYNPPNKETLSSVYIPAWYNIEFERLKGDLEKAPAVAITADHWTSLGGDHYMTVTAHYIKDWSLQNKVLETRAVYEAQTGEAIASEIKDCLTKFSIDSKVVALTVDNAANMAAGANVLDILRLPCFAHSMNVSAGKLYNETNFTRWLARIRSVVLWFKRVHMASVVLKEKLANLELPNHSVILDVKTRWNSMYLMVQRFAEIYPGLCAASRDPRLKKRCEKDKVEKLTDADLKKSEEFVDCMKILYTCTLAISCDKVPTVGQILPTWKRLEKSFTVQEDDSEFTRMVKSVIWRDMQKRYQDPDLAAFLEEAMALDTRFKSKLDANHGVWKRLEEKAATLIRNQSVHVKVEPKPDPDTPALTEECDDMKEVVVDECASSSKQPVKATLKRKRSVLEELFDDDSNEDDDEVIITNDEAPPCAEDQAHLEVEHFKAFHGQKLDANPLQFYREHQGKFPTITQLALKTLCIPGSSVPSERIFSLAGNTISQERVRIDPEKADMLIFLPKNAD